ncbi:MAG: PaaI family thioesterase [Rhodoferax sp.]
MSPEPAGSANPAAPAGVPEGFKPRNLGGGFMGVNGPIYFRKFEGGIQLGFRVEERHCNPMGVCHGGMIATFADMVCATGGHATSEAAKNRFLPTISLQLDYMAPARLGSWVQGSASVLRATRSMLFLHGLVTADGEPAARISGIFKIGPEFSGLQRPAS